MASATKPSTHTAPAPAAARAPACYLCASTALSVLTTELRHGPGRVLYCQACDLGMLEAAADGPPDLEAYYDGGYRREYGPKPGVATDYRTLFEAHVGYQQQRLDLLAPYLHGDAQVLEVGCSTGHLLHHLAPLVRRAVGVDLDSGATAFARDQLGLETYGCALDAAGLAERSFDLVLAVQTLEHVPDPVAACREFARYLKPDGRLFIEVPNLHDPLLRLYDAPRYNSFYYHRAHLWYFGETALRAVLARAGLDGEVGFAQDYNFLNHLHWALRNEPQPSAHSGLGAARLPLRAGVSEPLARELDLLMAETDRRYKAILARHKATENLCLLGTLRVDD